MNRKPEHLANAAAAVCLAACTIAANAQNLTRADEGRFEVGKCYAQCMDRAERTALALYRRSDRLTDLVISDEFFQLTESSQNNLVDLEEAAICSLAQDHVRGLDGCYAGCVDVELAYGVTASLARNRFREMLIRERDALGQVGLWRDYRETPVAGTDFELACNRYWSADGASGSASRVAALPAKVRTAQRQLSRRLSQPPRAKPTTTPMAR